MQWVMVYPMRSLARRNPSALRSLGPPALTAIPPFLGYAYGGMAWALAAGGWTVVLILVLVGWSGLLAGAAR